VSLFTSFFSFLFFDFGEFFGEDDFLFRGIGSDFVFCGVFVFGGVLVFDGVLVFRAGLGVCSRTSGASGTGELAQLLF